SNPPYLPADRADTRRLDAARRAAMVESVPVADWIAFMARSCRPDGQMTLIHRADRLEELLPAVAAHAGAIRVLPVWPRKGEPAKRVIVSARVGANTPTRICPGLVLHDETGSYTSAALRLIDEGTALEF
ncbi:MAG: methyltransferase, partial [Alphaproteobacteria bacterium]